MGSLDDGTGRPRIHKGLDDVYVKETRICLVDGVKGRLLYYGYDIRDLAKFSTFEETAFLLWHGRLPNREELAGFTAELAANRPIPKELVALLKDLPKNTAPIDAVRTAVSALGALDPDLNDPSRTANLRKALFKCLLPHGKKCHMFTRSRKHGPLCRSVLPLAA